MKSVQLPAAQAQAGPGYEVAGNFEIELRIDLEHNACGHWRMVTSDVLEPDGEADARWAYLNVWQLNLWWRCLLNLRRKLLDF